MKVKLYFKWFDMWSGVFVDTKKKTIYVQLLPMIGLKFSFGGKNNEVSNTR